VDHHECIDVHKPVKAEEGPAGISLSECIHAAAACVAATIFVLRVPIAVVVLVLILIVILSLPKVTARVCFWRGGSPKFQIPPLLNEKGIKDQQNEKTHRSQKELSLLVPLRLRTPYVVGLLLRPVLCTLFLTAGTLLLMSCTSSASSCSSVW
jgi:hypothetical protein